MDDNEIKLSLPQRLQHSSWKIRKSSYQQLQYLLKKREDPIYIGNQQYTTLKLIPYLNNLSDQHHPTVLLNGLNCVELILKDNNFGKYFLKLFNEGLQKFPLLSQQRKTILQKFLDLLQLVQIDPKILKDKLSLPHQKSVMYTLEVIGILNYSMLRGDILDISENHPKQSVKELALQIYQELYSSTQNVNINSIKCEPIKKDISKVNKKKQIINDNKKMQILDKLPHFEHLVSKQQQKFSTEIVCNLSSIFNGTIPPTIDLGHYIRIMIQDNNHIVSTNGIKILKYWYQHNWTTLPNSYPILFIFDKFKLHQTHPINSLLYQLFDSILLAGRSLDILQAIADALVEIKANVRYGAAMIFVRVIAITHKKKDLFEQYCVGQYPNYDVSQIKLSDKYRNKCYQLLLKDKKFKTMGQNIKKILGFYQKNNNLTITTRSRLPSSTLTRIDSGQTVVSTVSNTPKTKLTLQQQINQILALCSSERNNLKQLDTLINNFVTDILGGFKSEKYQLFYVCQILDFFLRKYTPSPSTSQYISQFTIKILKILSSKKSKQLSQDSLVIIFKISLCDIVLGQNLINILQNLSEKYPIQILIKILNNLNGKVRKKNRKYLLQWMNNQIPSQLITENYYMLIQRINDGQYLNHSKNILQIQLEKQPETRSHSKQFIGFNEEFTKKQNTKINQYPSFNYLKVENNPKIIPQVSEQHSMTHINQSIDLNGIQFELSHIAHKEQDQHIVDQKWEYFMSKHQKISKIDYSQKMKEDTHVQYQSQKSKIIEKNQLSNNFQKSIEISKIQLKIADTIIEDNHKNHCYNQKSMESEEIQYQNSKLEQAESNEEEQKNIVKYQIINQQKLNYMLNYTSNPYPHLRTLILIPFKSHPLKHQFLQELTQCINQKTLKHPQPYNAVLLLIILLFSQIKADKTLIGPLQYLYQQMASSCTTNEFLKTILSLLHSVIQETVVSLRSFLLTILGKSISRLLPFVEDAIELLRDLQQFYQIGEMFEMYQQQYNQVKTDIQGQSLLEVIQKGYIQEKQNLLVIVQGWLETNFKELVQNHIKKIKQDQNESQIENEI